MIKVFYKNEQPDAHAALQEWRRLNPVGYVLNCKTESSGLLHRVACPHMGDFLWQASSGQDLTRQRKVCSVSLGELHAWAREHGVSHLENCKDCAPHEESTSQTDSTIGTSPKNAAKPNQEQRAGLVWTELVRAAASGSTVTYGALAAAVGFHHRTLRWPLGLIQDYCLAEKLPPLTSLVVHGGDAQPGEGFIAWDVDDLRAAHALVHGFDWTSLSNPYGYARDGTTKRTLVERLLSTPDAAGDVYQRVKVRGQAQTFFREVLLEAYEYRCAFCGLSFQEALVAAHILPWAKCSPQERMDPRNGLLLCSNHHELFDAGWLSITSDYRVVYCDPEMVEAPYSEMDQALTVGIHGRKMRLPVLMALRPSPELIAKAARVRQHPKKR